MRYAFFDALFRANSNIEISSEKRHKYCFRSLYATKCDGLLSIMKKLQMKK